MAKKKIQINIRGEELKKKLNIHDGKDGEKGEKGDTVFVDKVIVEKTEVIKEVEKEETALDIADKLNKEEEIIDRKVIKGLESEIKRLEKMIKEKPIATGMDKSHLQYYDLTSQCDGVTKSFNIPGHYKVLEVKSTQFPVVYRPQIDWTVSGTVLTLTSEVSAPQQGQTFYIIYIG